MNTDGKNLLYCRVSKENTCDSLPSILQGIKLKHVVVPADYNAIWSATLIKVRTGGITQALGWVIGLE